MGIQPMLKKMYEKYGELVRYVIVGGLTTVVSLGSYYICVVTFLNPDIAVQLQAANVISWICAVSFAYITNRKYVFLSKNNKWLPEAVRFVGARISTLVIDMLSMGLFVSVLGINDKVAKIIVQFIVFALNYLFSKIFVFRKEENGDG